jgi:hypothetical protein
MGDHVVPAPGRRPRDVGGRGARAPLRDDHSRRGPALAGRGAAGRPVLAPARRRPATAGRGAGSRRPLRGGGGQSHAAGARRTGRLAPAARRPRRPAHLRTAAVRAGRPTAGGPRPGLRPAYGARAGRGRGGHRHRLLAARAPGAGDRRRRRRQRGGHGEAGQGGSGQGPRPAGRTGRPPHQRRGPRPHRHRVAVADAGGGAQVRPEFRQRRHPHGGVPRLRVRVLGGPARGLDRGAPPAAVRPYPRPGGRRPVPAGRRHVGGGRLQRAFR